MTEIDRIAASIDWPGAHHLDHLGPEDQAVAVRLVLKAMREPSEAMQVAAARTDVEVVRTADGHGRCITPSLIWRAGIDALLAE